MKLTLIRGLPGSGKSTMAKSFGCMHFEADMFHYENGMYRFRQDRQKEAHDACRQMTSYALHGGYDVAVSNTFTKRWEMQPYFDLADVHGATVEVIIATGNYPSIHCVPDAVIERMRARWEA